MTPVVSKLQFFRSVMPVDCVDVMIFVETFPDKQCCLYPLPTWPLKAYAGDLTPFAYHCSMELFYWGWSLPTSYQYLRSRHGFDWLDILSANLKPVTLPVLSSALMTVIVDVIQLAATQSIQDEDLWCASARCQQQTPTRSVNISDAWVSTVAVFATSEYRWMLMSSWLYMQPSLLLCVLCSAPTDMQRAACSAHCSMIHALVVSKLDYCNSVLVGVSAKLQRQLQSIVSTTAQIVFSARSSAHTMPLIQFTAVRYWSR